MIKTSGLIPDPNEPEHDPGEGGHVHIGFQARCRERQGTHVRGDMDISRGGR